MKRLLILSPAAFAVVLALFALMTALIHQEAPASVGVTPGVTIFPTLIESPDIVKPPTKPPQPAEEVEPPEQPSHSGENSKVEIEVAVANTSPGLTGLKVAPTGGTEVFLNSDGEATSLVTMEPLYPPIAKQKNLEGWVKLVYDINRTGRVENVRVVDSKPRGIFDRSARKALFKWKYNPSIVDGRAVASIGHKVVLEFNLEKE